MQQQAKKTIWIFAVATAWMLNTIASQAALIHAYSMNEGSGTSTADAVGSSDGTFGSDMDNNNWVAGIEGTAVMFDPAGGPGNNQYINMGNDASFNLENMGTIMAWVRPTSVDAEGWLWAKGAEPEGTGNTGHKTIYSGTGEGLIQVEFPAATNGTMRAASVPAPGTWTHVAVSWSTHAREARVYLNGQPTGGESIPNPLQSDNSVFVVGHDLGVNTHRMFDGAIDELKVFDDFMTGAEVDFERFNFIEAGLQGSQITSVAITNTALLSISTTTNKQYNLERSVGGGPFVFTGVTLLGDGNDHDLYDPDPSISGASYRVTVWP